METSIFILPFLLQFVSSREQGEGAYKEYRLEKICKRNGAKLELPLHKRPHVFTFNSTVEMIDFKCHLELEQGIGEFGFLVFIEQMNFSKPGRSGICEEDSLQFGIDKLIFTTEKSRKFCGTVPPISPLYTGGDQPSGFDFKGTDFGQRVYREEGDNEIDVWIKISPGESKSIKLVVTPFKKQCDGHYEYRNCPGTNSCIRSELFCDGKPNCLLNSDDENHEFCHLTVGGFTDSSLGIPVIIIIAVISLLSVVFLLFLLKKAKDYIKHLRSTVPVTRRTTTPCTGQELQHLRARAATTEETSSSAGGGGGVVVFLQHQLGDAESGRAGGEISGDPPPYSELEDPPPYSEIDQTPEVKI